MALARLITAGVMVAVFVGGGKLVAGSGALVVDLATHFPADLPFEGDTTQSFFLVGSLHPHFVGAGLLGELQGHGVRRVTGFSPVEFNPEESAAGAAGPAGMSHPY